jgi:L,D-peptidoglycan transpeptidase YkuD (ErfK/YbiS/YcfS/YnhG family)
MSRWRVMVDELDQRRGRLVGPMFGEPCALGKNGLIADVDGVEGDGKTPIGTYPLRRVFYRPDREETPHTALPTSPLSPNLGWCDAPTSPHYNKLVRLPFGESHEALWRDDSLYDLILVIGHNDAPVVPGRGSCIFIHVARDGFAPTLGCVALEVGALRRLLRQFKSADSIRIG